MSSTQATAPAAGKSKDPLAMKRNIGIIAHIDAGKTTTTERILFYTGKEHKMGEVHEGTATMDYMPEERERGITITAAATSCYWKGLEINLIDTPGHIDFTAEVQRSLRVLDGAVVVFSGVDGVEAQSETVWRQADRFGVPRLCFINKMDRVGAELWPVIDQIRDRLGAKPYPIQMPVGKEGDFCGVIDLFQMQQHVFDQNSQGKKVTTTEIAPEYKAEAEKRREELIALLADCDDKIAEIFLNEQKPTTEQMVEAMRRITIASKGFPVLCGSAYKYTGIQPVLDAVQAYLPSPTEGRSVSGIDPEDETKILERRPIPTDPFTGLAFKTIFDSHGDLTFVRVYSGSIKAGDRIYNQTRKKKERIERLYLMHADERETIETAGPGDIVAVGGLKHTYTGDTICPEEHPILLEPPKFPDTVVAMAIEPKTSDDKDRLAHALAKLAKEDPTFTFTFNSETGQMIIGGMGELHLEIIKSKLTREHKVEANIGNPRVSYRETITNSAEAEGKFVQQSGGRGQYGVCYLRVEPFENNEEDHMVFESEIKGGSIPREFIPSIEHGCRGAMRSGILGGYPLINVKVTLLDGKYHEVDSSDLAFEMAGSIGFKDAMRKAGLIFLEPLMTLEVVTPEDSMGNLIGDLNSRRAQINEVTDRGHLKVINAKVPLAEMFRYANVSRSLSSGRATYSMEPRGYEPVPRNKYKDIIGDEPVAPQRANK